MNSTASEFMLSDLLQFESDQVSTGRLDQTLEQALKQKLMAKKGLIRMEKVLSEQELKQKLMTKKGLIRMKKVLSEWELRVRLRTWNRIIQYRQGKYELEEGEILDIHLY